MDDVRQLISRARTVTVLTGAEVSAESGLPAFRMTQAAYRERPAEIWDWYAARREIVRQLAPNPLHRVLAAFAASRGGQACLVTQNVDDLQQRAGATGVICLHGNLMEDAWLAAPSACCRAAEPVPGSPPRCATCGNLRRPAVTWVDEAPPAGAIEAAAAAVRQGELLIAIGEAGRVPPSLDLAAMASAAGARIVSLGSAPSELDRLATHVVRGRLADLLPPLLAPG